MVFIAKALNASWTYPVSKYHNNGISDGESVKKTLGIGAWVGIALGCAAAVALIVTAAVFLSRTKKTHLAKGFDAGA